MFSAPVRHSLIAAGALALIAMVAVQSNTVLQGSLLRKDATMDIAFEHVEPLSAHVKMSMQNGEAIIEVSHEGNETISVSVPEEWRRTEVRGAPLHEVTEEPPMLGYIRWRFPPKTAVVFYAKTAPSNLLIHNPSKVPLKVQGIQVDLLSDSVDQDIVLIQDEATMLWEE